MYQLRQIPTMQPTLVDAPPSGDGWLHEIKYDGYRTQLVIWSGNVNAYTRNGSDWSSRYQPIVDDAKAVPALSAIIDGEVAVQNDNGVTDFHLLASAIKWHSERLVFFAFDLLHLDGENLDGCPIEERRAKLRFLLDQVPGSHIVMSDEYNGDGKTFFELAEKHGLEGIVSKRKGSKYHSGESRLWLKTKCWATDEFDVIGVDRDKKGLPYALLADAHGYRGAAYVTLPNALRTAFWDYVSSQKIEMPSVIGAGRPTADWLRPGLRASVRHLRGGDKLRNASVKDLVIDRG